MISCNYSTMIILSKTHLLKHFQCPTSPGGHKRQSSAEMREEMILNAKEDVRVSVPSLNHWGSWNCWWSGLVKGNIETGNHAFSASNIEVSCKLSRKDQYWLSCNKNGDSNQQIDRNFKQQNATKQGKIVEIYWFDMGMGQNYMPAAPEILVNVGECSAVQPYPYVGSSALNI